MNNNVKEYRERLGLNQGELGKLCKVSRQTISSIERGEYHPSILVALRIAKICGVSIEQLFSLEEDE